MTAAGGHSLALGTMTFGDTVDRDGAAEILNLALEAGVFMIDTANGYAGGATEIMLGELLVGRRDQVALASKAGMPHPDAEGEPPLSARALRASVEGSLHRLRTDRLDLFYLHQPDRGTPVEETLSVIAELVAEGKILELGVSNYAAWQISELTRAADRVGAPHPRVAQQLYSLIARRLDEEYAEYADVAGLQTVVYNPLGGGLLTGRHRFQDQPAQGRFGDSRLAGMYTERYWSVEIFAAVEQLGRVASDAGLPLSELALRWLRGRSVVDTVLVGGSRIDHIRSNIDALARGPLPADAQQACDEVGAALRGPMPAYNR